MSRISGSGPEVVYGIFVLHGLAEFSMLSKYRLDTSIQFKDMLSSMFTMTSDKDEDEDLSDNSELYK